MGQGSRLAARSTHTAKAEDPVPAPGHDPVPALQETEHQAEAVCLVRLPGIMPDKSREDPGGTQQRYEQHNAT